MEIGKLCQSASHSEVSIIQPKHSHCIAIPNAHSWIVYLDHHRRQRGHNHQHCYHQNHAGFHQHQLWYKLKTDFATHLHY